MTSDVVFDTRDVHCDHKRRCRLLCPVYCQRCTRNLNRDHKKWYSEDPWNPECIQTRVMDHFVEGPEIEHPEEYNL